MFLRVTIVSRVCGSPLFDWLSPSIDQSLVLTIDQKRASSQAAAIGLFNQFARDLGGISINQVKFTVQNTEESNSHVPRSSTPQPHSAPNGSFSAQHQASIISPVKRGNPRAYPRYGLNYHRTLPPIKRSINQEGTELSSLFSHQSLSQNTPTQFAMVFASNEDLLLAAIPALSEHDQSINQTINQSVYEAADRVLVTFATAYHAHLAALKPNFLHDAKTSEDAINDEKYLHDPHPFSNFDSMINQLVNQPEVSDRRSMDITQITITT